MSSSSSSSITRATPLKDASEKESLPEEFWTNKILLATDSSPSSSSAASDETTSTTTSSEKKSSSTLLYYPMTRQAAKLCGIFTEIADLSNEDEQIFLPLECKYPDALPLIIGYCEYHKDSAAPELPMPLRQPIDYYLDRVDKQFIDEFLVSPEAPKNNENLMKVMQDAHYLDCKPLIELCTAKIASMIQGKNAAEIRDVLNMKKKDFGDRKFRTEEEIQAFKDLKPEEELISGGEKK